MKKETKNKNPIDDRSLWLFRVFLAGFFVRLIFIWESQDQLIFFDPIIDAHTYHQMAKDFSEDFMFSTSFFWQPFLYPFSLGLFYWMFGVKIMGAKIAQALLGGISCVLICKISEFFLEKKQSIAVGMIWALYIPSVIYDVEILGTGQATFFLLLCLYLSLVYEKNNERSPALSAALGLSFAFSILARPIFLPISIVVSCYLFRGFAKNKKSLGVYLLCFLTPLMAVSSISYLGTGKFSFLPTSGGLNFYLGNSKNMCETINIRPGYQWKKLQTEATSEKSESQTEGAFFLQKTLKGWVESPSIVVDNFFAKLQRFFSSREIPRNINIYDYKETSWFAQLGLLKIGPYGLFSGFIFSFCFYGMFLLRRRVSFVVWIFIAIYSASILLIFVATRYRLPVMPLYLMFSCYGARTFVLDAAHKRKKEIAFGMVNPFLFLLTQLATPVFCEEYINYKAEMFYCLGTNQDKEKNYKDAITFYEESLKLDAHHLDSLHNLMFDYRRIGRLEKAKSVLNGVEENILTENNHGVAHLVYKDLRQEKAAFHHLQEALRKNPQYAEAWNYQGEWYREHFLFDKAVDAFEKAIDIKPFSAVYHNNLAVTYGSMKKMEQALHSFGTAIRLNPGYGEAHFNLGLTQESSGDYEAAKRSYQISLQVGGPAHAKSRLKALMDR